MDYQKQIVEFLSKPENLSIAVEVSKNMEALRKKFHKSFWEDITEALKIWIKDSNYSDRWFVECEDEYDLDYKSCMISIKNIPKNYEGLYLSLSLTQDPQRYKYRLHYGLVWNKECKTTPISNFYKQIINKSNEAGFPASKGNIWWPTLSFLDIYLRSDEFLLQYGLGKAEFLNGLSERIWAYFEVIEPELYQFNKELIHV